MSNDKTSAHPERYEWLGNANEWKSCTHEEAIALSNAKYKVREIRPFARCTCPSGDGSLRHPCPSHPATLATVKHGGCVQLGDGLLPCPFCGARAERIDLGPGSGDNEGGSCVACTACQSSGPVEFGYKENFISDWNRRALSAQPSPGGQDAARYERLFLSAVEMPTKISLRLGLEPNSDGVEPMLAAIDALTARQPVGSMSSEASQVARGMVAHCIEHRLCMGMDEGFASFGPDVEHPFVQELREFAEDARQPVCATVKDSLTVGGGQAVVWVSPGQLEEFRNGTSSFGSRIPARVEKGGLFDMPLYAAPTAQAVDLGRWAMHLQGPDDVHPAPSKADALEVANAINREFANSQVKPYAVVVPWVGSESAHAEGLNDWAEQWNGIRADSQAVGNGQPELPA